MSEAAAGCPCESDVLHKGLDLNDRGDRQVADFDQVDFQYHGSHLTRCLGLGKLGCGHGIGGWDMSTEERQLSGHPRLSRLKHVHGYEVAAARERLNGRERFVQLFQPRTKSFITLLLSNGLLIANSVPARVRCPPGSPSGKCGSDRR